MTRPAWLTIHRGSRPLLVSLPHTGTEIPDAPAERLTSSWLARKDTDWWIDRLYAFAADLGAAVMRTAISRTVIDVNRDPSGMSMYPGQTTTALCPTETFDGEALYHRGGEPDTEEIASRRREFFDPYHAALSAEIAHLRATHPRVVLYDCHSIRSVIPRLFEGELPQFNIGTNGGVTCGAALTRAVEARCDQAGLTRVTNGRFSGGYITRHYGRPDAGVHAIQMELACRGYMAEPIGPVTEADWPVPYRDEDAAAMATTLRSVLDACLAFAERS
jgi:formiminoglutamase